VRAVIYSRVSTRDQDPENQLAQLRAFAAAQGWDLTREYVDYESGRSAERAEFRRLFQDANRRQFDLVLFWSLDRFSREGALATLSQLNVLTHQGVQFRSYTEQYLDSCGVFGEAVIAILAAIAKQERVRLSERTRAGIDRARAEGKHIGRSRKVLDCERLRQLHAEGLTVQNLAERFGASRATIARRLRNASTHFIGTPQERSGPEGPVVES
jgi:DNA invertase Pin-like site-specific DNA recombinase